jgi:hypothetical protein
MNVITNAHVTNVDRSLINGPVLVDYTSGQHEQTLAFDHVVVATNPRQAAAFLTLTQEEKTLFDQLIYFEYYTIIATVDGLSTKQGLTTIPQHCYDKSHIGHTTAFYAPHEGVPTYSFYAYGKKGISSEKILGYLEEDLKKVGATIKEVHYNKCWDFFPHGKYDFTISK